MQEMITINYHNWSQLSNCSLVVSHDGHEGMRFKVSSQFFLGELVPLWRCWTHSKRWKWNQQTKLEDEETEQESANHGNCPIMSARWHKQDLSRPRHTSASFSEDSQQPSDSCSSGSCFKASAISNSDISTHINSIFYINVILYNNIIYIQYVNVQWNKKHIPLRLLYIHSYCACYYCLCCSRSQREPGPWSRVLYQPPHTAGQSFPEPSFVLRRIKKICQRRAQCGICCAPEKASNTGMWANQTAKPEWSSSSCESWLGLRVQPRIFFDRVLLVGCLPPFCTLSCTRLLQVSYSQLSSWWHPSVLV